MNIIVDSNYALKEFGRRYFQLDINPIRRGDREYWKELRTCSTDEVGSAFLSYMLEYDTENFSHMHSMPDTKSNLTASASKMHPHEMF